MARSCGESLQRVYGSLWFSNHSNLVLTLSSCFFRSGWGTFEWYASWFNYYDVLFDSEFTPCLHLIFVRARRQLEAGSELPCEA